MGRRANPYKEHNIRIEKTIKLWNRLVRFHNFLVRAKTDNSIIENFWKNFKPLLPPKYRKNIPKISLKNVSFNEMRIITYRI